jgi:hypothetical protein
VETVVSGLHEAVPLVVRQSLWLQHHGAASHYREYVLQWLNAIYGGR